MAATGSLFYFPAAPRPYGRADSNRRVPRLQGAVCVTKGIDPKAESVLRQFLSVLSHMGWGLSRQARPQLVERATQVPPGALWVALSLTENQHVVAVSLPGALPDPSEAFRRYEDLVPVHRGLIEAFGRRGLRADSLIVLGERGAHLLDVEQEDLLLVAEDREEIDGRLLPLLDVQAVARGSLVSYPRKSLRQRARELADWTQLWTTQFGGRLNLPRPLAERFFQWLHLARVAELHGVGSATGDRLDDVTAARTATAARRQIEERFRVLHEQWYLLQEKPARPILEITSSAARTGDLEECLQSFALLSRSKFTAEVFAEAFADNDLRVLSWRHSLTGETPSGESPEPHPYPDELFRREVDVALDDLGTIVLLRTFDSLVERVYHEALDRASALERGDRPGTQLDFFSDAPQECRPEEAARYVLRRLLRPHTHSASRAALTRMVLLTRCCEWDGRLHAAHLPFPRVEPRLTQPPVETRASADSIAEWPEVLN